MRMCVRVRGDSEKGFAVLNPPLYNTAARKKNEIGGSGVVSSSSTSHRQRNQTGEARRFSARYTIVESSAMNGATGLGKEVDESVSCA